MIEKVGEVFLSFLQRNGMVAIVILAVLAVRFLLRKCPKKYSYWLWAIVGIRMLFDLPVASRFSLFNLFRLSGESTTTVGTEAQHTNNMTMPNHLFTTAQNSPAATEIKPVSPAAVPEMSFTQTVPAVLFFVWIAGMVLVLSYGIYSYVKCRKLVRTAVILKKPLHLYGLQLQSADGKRKNRRMDGVWECDGIPSPFVLGIFRPQIYIPFRMEDLGQQYILAHECCHIRRHDPLWKLLAFVLLAVYWWNPLVWVAFFYMVRDMEMSCDEAVIESFGNGIKKGYSESLLAFAMERHPYSFAPVAFGEGDAGKRIKNVLNFRKPHTWLAAVMTVIIVVVAVCCLTNQQPRINKQVLCEQGIRQWAQAFCDRDVNTILKLATNDAQKALEKENLLFAGNNFGWSSPWPWGVEGNTNPDYTVDTQTQTAVILYYAMVSDPHVTVWKETIHYTYENNKFQVTQEELKMYDEISTSEDFDAAYAHGIKGTAMDYRTNEMAEVLNEHAKNDSGGNDPLLSPVQSARYLLNLSDDDSRVQLAADYRVNSGVLVHITFLKDGTVRQVKMIQPWGKDGIWIPEDVQAG